jgi:hypothetical protein
MLPSFMVVNLGLTLRKEHRLKVLENGVRRRILARDRGGNGGLKNNAYSVVSSRFA